MKLCSTFEGGAAAAIFDDTKFAPFQHFMLEQPTSSPSVLIDASGGNAYLARQQTAPAESPRRRQDHQHHRSECAGACHASENEAFLHTFPRNQVRVQP